MQHAALPTGIRALPRAGRRRWVARVRACLRRTELDRELAEGEDPWGSGARMVRAARLGSLRERRSVAAGLRALVELAERGRAASAYLDLRHRIVLEERTALLALADRLDEPEPVEISVLAQLHLLLCDPTSPVYDTGTDPGELAETMDRCLEALREE
jgi:hypothetical protein